jgi:hypothetical protein
VRNNADAVIAAVLGDGHLLPSGCRLLALALAHLADWRTGRGIAGQGRLARAMGVDARTVRRLKRQLAEAVDSPVVVTWAHRQRADGLNGSDIYTITVKDTGQFCRHTGQFCVDTGQIALTSSSQGSSQDHPSRENNENLILGDAPKGAPNNELIPVVSWRPLPRHRTAAAKRGVDFDVALASFLAWHAAGRNAAGLKRRADWDAAFGGWLKRQRPEASTPADDDIEPEPTTAEELADYRASRGKWAPRG